MLALAACDFADLMLAAGEGDELATELLLAHQKTCPACRNIFNQASHKTLDLTVVEQPTNSPANVLAVLKVTIADTGICKHRFKIRIGQVQLS